MTGTVLQLIGLAALVTAGILISVPVALGAVGVVLLYLGLASERGG